TARVYHLTDINATTATTVQQNVGAVMEVIHNPASGLYANFSANVTSGASPLAVTFQDTSFTSDPSGVQTWAWDLDGDGMIDDTTATPTYTYNTCGSYDVTLTVTDTMHPTSTITKTGFIDVDPQLRVTADFTATPSAGAVPLSVNFTDTSMGSPTSWAWDFDNDGTIDSFVQNPSWIYTLPGFYDVSLTATNACYSDTIVKTSLIQVVGATSNTESAEYLEYQFNELRGTSVANTASTTFFPSFGTVPNTGWHVDPGRSAWSGNEAGFGALGYNATTGNYVDSGTPLNISGSVTVAFWQRRDPASTSTSPFGYFFSDNSFRCFMGSAGIFFGGGTGSPLSGSYNGGFTAFLTPGVWNHYAVVIDDAAGLLTWYENGVPSATTWTFAPGTYAYSGTANLTVGATPSGSSRATSHFDMDDFRMYSRALNQTEIMGIMAQENPSTSLYDFGCTDGLGFNATMGANGAPKLGNAAFELIASGMEPNRTSALAYGIEAHFGGLFPFDLSGTGLFGAGCNLHVLPIIITSFGSGTGTVAFPTPIPLDPSVAGGHVYVQAITLGSGAFSGLSDALDVNFQL
ncbi:MAG: PKD domain-containing protein, partial [Planctomycetes bacterium]|nr:PKD domain-containing protein [Planctomycetota bacterium]